MGRNSKIIILFDNMFNTLRGSSVAALLLATAQAERVPKEVCTWLKDNVNWELENPWDSIKDKEEVKKENYTQYDFYYAFGTCWYEQVGGDVALDKDGPTYAQVCTFLKDKVDWKSEDPFASAKKVPELKDLNEQQFYGFATSCYDAYEGKDGTSQLTEACTWIGNNVDFKADDVWATIKDKKEVKDAKADEETFWYTAMMCWWRGGGAAAFPGDLTFKQLCDQGKSWVTNPGNPWPDVKDREEMKGVREAQFMGIWNACKVYDDDKEGKKPVTSSEAGMFSKANERKPPPAAKAREKEAAVADQKAAEAKKAEEAAASALLASGMAILALSLV